MESRPHCKKAMAQIHPDYVREKALMMLESKYELKIFIGYDLRFPLAYAVAVRSLILNGALESDIRPMLLPQLCGAALYDRPTSFKDGQMIDDIS